MPDDNDDDYYYFIYYLSEFIVNLILLACGKSCNVTLNKRIIITLIINDPKNSLEVKDTGTSGLLLALLLA